MTFETTVNQVLEKHLMIEAVTDIPRDTLDPTVFNFFEDGRLPEFKDAIKKQINIDISKINAMVSVVNFFVIGSILTPQYSSKSDIDVNVQIDAEEVDLIASADLLQLMKRLNGKYATGTTHPINYYLVTEEYNLEKTEAAYDIGNDRWIKTPEAIRPDLQSYMMRFQTMINNMDLGTGELRRDLIDFEELKYLKKEDVRDIHNLIKKKIEEISEDVRNLVSVYHDIKILRQMAFDRTLTPEEIQMYGHKNRLPENVIYKLMERYYYIKFLKHMEAILDGIEEDGRRLNISDIENIKQAGKGFWNNG